MHPAVAARLEELIRERMTKKPRFDAQARAELAWDFGLTEDKRVYSEEAFSTDAEAAAAGFPEREEGDGARRHYKLRKVALELTEEECEALSQAFALGRGAAVPEAAGRVLMVFGVLFVLAFALAGVLYGAAHRSWLRWMAMTISGVLSGLMMYWVGRLIGEVRALRGMLLWMARKR